MTSSLCIYSNFCGPPRPTKIFLKNYYMEKSVHETFSKYGIAAVCTCKILALNHPLKDTNNMTIISSHILGIAYHDKLQLFVVAHGLQYIPEFILSSLFIICSHGMEVQEALQCHLFIFIHLKVLCKKYVDLKNCYYIGQQRNKTFILTLYDIPGGIVTHIRRGPLLKKVKLGPTKCSTAIQIQSMEHLRQNFPTNSPKSRQGCTVQLDEASVGKASYKSIKVLHFFNMFVYKKYT